MGLSFGNWTLGSTMVGIGLNWWQSILVIFASQTISSIAMFFNSRCASVYHIGYPVVARSVFGMWGSYYFVGARAALAIIWYGVQRKSFPSLSSFISAYSLSSLLWRKFHGKYSPLHLWTPLHRHPKPYPRVDWDHDSRHAVFLLVLGRPFPILRLPPIPTSVVLLVQVDHCPSSSVGLVYLLHGKHKSESWFCLYLFVQGQQGLVHHVCNQ